MIFDKEGNSIGMHQLEHEQIYPQPGWVEHDPMEIWENTKHVIAGAIKAAKLQAANVAAVGITNQRETTIVWDKTTGKPVYNAIVWMDTRTKLLVKEMIEKYCGIDAFRQLTGLPFSTYFSAFKIKWLIENVEAVQNVVTAGTALFGTIDTWLVWNLTGGPDGGIHITDPTNASRTMLMNIETVQWDKTLCDDFSIPMSILPEIKSSSEVHGETSDDSPFYGRVPIAGILGDQQAAMIGQTCFKEGDAKNTYGTGCFLGLNTGERVKHSSHGLITTVCYKIGNKPPVYALEGSIAMAGALVLWIRDNLQLIKKSPDIERLARTVDDNGGIYFVPAFSGLYAPYWRDNARGVIVGMTRYVNRGHIARATLEATAFQTRDLLEAMTSDTGITLSELKVDGGMVNNELLMQFQADILQIPIVRPEILETTALGAAYAAGLAVGYWESKDALVHNWVEKKRWLPKKGSCTHTELYKQWKRAVERTFGWVE